MRQVARARIDLAALRHNLAKVKQAAPKCHVMAVIKANGYGHGMLRAARALDEVDAFAVARIDEAILLRDAGFEKPVVILQGYQDLEELEACAENGFEPAISQAHQCTLLAQASTPIGVWLKFDTGMHRLGLPAAEAASVIEQVNALKHVQHPVKLMSHFACADNPEDAHNAQQLNCFVHITKDFEYPRSMANSAAILSNPDAHFDWVRPGIMLYGVSPFKTGTGPEHGLEPVMTLTTQLIAVNALSKGDSVGYGATYTCPEDMPVGVAAIGYGDGYPRHAKEGTPVLVNGQRAPLIGRVSMDMITLDLRDCSTARSGDEVTAWGSDLSVEEIANHAKTIAYELLCGVTGRVEFHESDF